MLKYLTDVQSENIFEDGAARGFKLTFLFSDNPFFGNKARAGARKGGDGVGGRGSRPGSPRPSAREN